MVVDFYDFTGEKKLWSFYGGREKIVLHYKDNGITLLKEYIIGAAGWGTAREITQRDR